MGNTVHAPPCARLIGLLEIPGGSRHLLLLDIYAITIQFVSRISWLTLLHNRIHNTSTTTSWLTLRRRGEENPPLLLLAILENAL